METLRFLDDAVTAGKISYYGFSNYLGWQLTKAAATARLHGWAPPVTLQPQYNLLVRGIEHEVVPAAQDENIGLLPWSPLAGGWLSGKYTRDQAPTGATRLGENPERGMEAWEKRNADPRTWKVIDAVTRIASAEYVSASQVALGWLMAQPAVTSVILGARTVEQLEDNLGAGDSCGSSRTTSRRSRSRALPSSRTTPTAGRPGSSDTASSKAVDESRSTTDARRARARRAPARRAPARRARPQPVSDRRHLALTLLVAGTFFMENLDGTILATAAPTIGRAYGIDSAAVGVAITAYLVTLAVLIPISGWLTERLGARVVFTGAIAIFTIASALCAISGDLTQLTAMRILQGAGGAMMVPVGRLAVLRVTEKRDLVRAIAWLTWPALAAPIFAPLVGGLLVTYASWQWIFLLNIPLGVVAFVAALRLTPVEVERSRKPLDWLGFVLTFAGVGGIVVFGALLADASAPAVATIVAASGRRRAHGGGDLAPGSHRASAARPEGVPHRDVPGDPRRRIALPADDLGRPLPAAVVLPGRAGLVARAGRRRSARALRGQPRDQTGDDAHAHPLGLPHGADGRRPAPWSRCCSRPSSPSSHPSR